MDVQAFKDRYPQVQASDPAILDALDDASAIVGTAWAQQRERGIGLYAAHVLTLDGQAGSSGKSSQTVTSKKVGEVQINYATRSDDQAVWFDRTHYGQRYWMLYQAIRSRMTGAFVT